MTEVGPMFLVADLAPISADLLTPELVALIRAKVEES